MRTKGSKDWVDLPDVGFGISQVLPVLVQCFYAPPRSIIVIEQPEIHLHPSAQSALADVMIDVINSKENGNDRNIQLIIETHSEHFLRRLQRRIAEGVIDEEKSVGLLRQYYQNPCHLRASANRPVWQHSATGPSIFLAMRWETLSRQAEAAMNKRMKQSGTELETSK